MLKPWRISVVYAVAIPLALVLGILVSSPDPYSFGMLGVILLFLASPLFLKWHHALLVVSWNVVCNFFFLPGQPDLWLIMACLSFGISALNCIMFQKRFLRVPEMTRPLFFLGAVVLGTALYRGGIGIRALGGNTYGGKYYILILVAILGYFAFTAEALPHAKGGRLAAGYFLGGATGILPNLAYALGPAFYFLYYFVPAGNAQFQVAADYGLTDIDRIVGLSPASTAIFCFLLIHYGIRGIFDWTKPWRLLFFCVTLAASFFSGFRSTSIVLLLTFCFQFYFEGLFRTRYLPVFAGLALFVFAFLLVFSEKMPPTVQRTISFLPAVKVDPEVRADARGSTEWRHQMWAVVWKDVPKYLLIGKGYGIDPTDLFLTTESIRLGLMSTWEEPLLAGDYHNGALSILIPFGLPGMAAFLWVLGAGFWVLQANFHHGDVRLRRVNSVLLSYYLVYCLGFFFIFGAFSSQFFIFLGLVGLSVSLNGGVKRPAWTRAKDPTLPRILELEQK